MPLKKSLRTHLGIIIALLLAFTLIVGNAAAQDPPPDPIQPNIVGGQPADPHEYPWQALVYAGGYMCGGSLIDAEWVLTAAHCVTNGSTVYAPSAFDIRLGEHNRYTSDGTEQAKTVDQVVPHPSYDASTSDYDVALLHLSSPASLNSAVATIALNSLADVDGQMSTVTGWGTTSYGGSTSDVLMEVQVPIVSNATCNAAYGSITSRMLCAGYAAGGKDSCQGDSGGPLIIPDGSGGWRQAGVVSWGSGCADPGYYGVYSRVSSVKSWIDSYLAGAVTPTPSPTPVTPASNDDFSAAAMTALPYSSNQNTATATTATDDPIFTCGGGGQKYHTVWYKYAATSTGTLAVNTNGSNYDTVLAVWTGSRGALQNVGCDDDSGLDNQSDLQVSVVAGTTYFIEAAGYFPDSSGSLNLSASFIAPPVPPDINVTPASVELTLPGGLTTTQTLTIENTGDGVLSFNLAITGAEISAGSMAIRQSENDWRAVAFPADKIDPALQQDISLMSGEPISFMVYLTEQADLSAAYGIPRWAERGQYVYNTLFETARRTQPELIAYLGPKAVQRTFYIVNAIAASGSWDTIVGLANRADVVYIEALGSYSIPNPQPAADLSIATAEWGVGKIGADQVWNQWGIRGDGIVVASIDTGVYSSHPALVSQYRGTASGSHNYNWYDPTNTYPTAPGDNNGHGTHTVGTMVGVDGTTQTGVAPAAQWIAAKGCSSSSCNSIDLLAAAEWVLAPYPIGGSASSGSASQRPHVVNNSWGGGGGDLWYQAAVTAWRAAGIFPAFAAGNSGPDAGSIGSPGDYADSFASGATDSNDNIASFSGRGPSSLTSETKPDISAPGYSIRSTWNDGLYNTISGTSMASPHTAGCVALVRAANSSLTVSQIEAILTSTATDLGDTGPDDNFGYGRLNCYAAVAQARTDVWLTASPLTGQVASRGSTTVQLGVNTTHLANGDYIASLTISSTDPDESTLAVPVTLHVSDGGVPIPPTATPTATRTPAPTATPTFTPVTPDSNDDFDAAEVLSTMPYSSNQDTYGATTAADDPQMPCVSSKKYNTVWYKYSPTSSGNLAVNTYGSSYDTVLAIWTGSRGALQSVACNDDDSGWQSAVEAPVLAGTTYYIEVAGYYLSSYGTLNLSASLNYAATPVPTATPIPTATATPDAPPQITAVNLTDAGNTLEIIGSNFVNPVTASLGTYPLSGITFISSGQLTAAVPSALPPGTYPLLVTNPDGQMAFYPAALTVGSSTLDILGISPERGSTDLPTLLHAFGLNFSQDTTIMLDDQPLVTQFVDQNSLWAIVPAGQTARKYDVSVVENGSTDTLFLAYTVFSATDDDLLSTSNLLWTDPGTLRAGSPAKTGLVVYHQGGGQTLTDVEVSFEIDTPAGNTLALGSGISDLPPNRYNTTTPVTWTPSTAGIYTLRATIDPDNGIPESDETNNTIERTVTVLPATIDATPPDIDSFTATLPPASTLAALQVTATDPAPGSGVNSVMFIEYEFSDSARQWAVVRQSDWLRYQTTPYGWEVSSTAGMKYLQAWVADGAGNISLTPASGLLNYVPAADSLLEGQARLYRYRLAAGEQITVRTEPSSGDPDIYLWATASTTPDASSYAAGAAVDQISYTASQATTVQIAIYGYTAAQFGQSIQVVAAGSSSAVTSGPESTEVNAKTPLDDAIVTADNSPSDRQGLPDAPIKTGSPAVYLPVIVK